MASLPPPREYRVRLDTSNTTGKSNDEIVYQLCGLTESHDNENETRDKVAQWTQFCAHTFRDKKPIPPPASYFARHFYNDPQRQSALIRVAKTTSGDIVASCRVFVRQLSVHSSTTRGAPTPPAECGGIGEVCTSQDHRRRGLAAQLLLDAVACMQALRVPLSVLHAAPEFRPVYQSAGYVSSTSRWSNVTVQTQALCRVTERNEMASWSVRAPQFPADTPQLASIHESYSQSRFVGCIHRSNEYWEQYLAVELQDAWWVAIHDNVIQGWLSLRRRGSETNYQVRDFGCRQIDAVPTVFRYLLRHAVQTSTSELSMAPDDSFRLQVPTQVLDELMDATMDSVVSDASSDDDLGWMYQVLDATMDLSDFWSRPHLIWPADSF